jgi:hypothetical protein
VYGVGELIHQSSAISFGRRCRGLVPRAYCPDDTDRPAGDVASDVLMCGQAEQVGVHRRPNKRAFPGNG